jgi:uncharacterized damage-inducible protein DinB
MSHSEPGDTSVLTDLFRHNTWANLKLLAFCEGLSPEQLDAAAVGGYGTIRSTLVHIVGAEESYVNRVSGKLPSPPLTRDPFPGFDALKAVARWAGDELLALALAARGDTLVRQQPPRLSIEYKLTGLMVQVINHATEHRAQVSTILTQLGLEPPEMSGWQYMDEMGLLREIHDDGSPVAGGG